MHRFASKLSRLKGVLGAWNKQVFGNVYENSRQAKLRVKQLEPVFDVLSSGSDIQALNRAQTDHL